MKKKCSRCNSVKLPSQFYHEKRNKSGRRSECKACTQKARSTKDVAVRQCIRCHQEKPVTAFGNYGNTTRVLPWCKTCVKPTKIVAVKPLKTVYRTATKQCKRCGAVKSMGEFGGHAKTKDGRHTHCLACCRALSSKTASKVSKSNNVAINVEKVNKVEKTKVCTKCKGTKPASSFYQHNRAKDGLQPWCKVCQSASRRSPSLTMHFSNDTKVCAKCNTKKAKNDFHKHTASEDGVQIWCKKCYSAYNAARTAREKKARLAKAVSRVAKPKTITNNHKISGTTSHLPVTPAQAAIDKAIANAVDVAVSKVIDKVAEKYISEKLDRLVSLVSTIGGAIIEEGRAILASIVPKEKTQE